MKKDAKSPKTAENIGKTFVIVCKECGRKHSREEFTCVMKKIKAFRCQCGGVLEVTEE